MASSVMDPAGLMAQVDSQIATVVRDMHDLISITEKKYSYIYENLPVLEQDIQLGVREVEILLGHLVYNARQEVQASPSVTAKTLAEIQADFSEMTATFLNEELVNLLFHTFLDKSGTDKQSFYELITVVREVEEALAVLRDLALNSIIFSIRVGEQGAGFQILSDRINQVSMELGRQFAVMKETIGRLNCWNDEFQKALVDFIECEEELKNKYKGRFETEFTRIAAVLKTVCLVLDDNLHHTKSAVSGVSRVMVLVQGQDIIRQNIENLTKCIDMILYNEVDLDNSEREKCLDYIVFANQVLELCLTLIENIDNSLHESVLDIGQVLSEIYNEASELEEEAASLSGLFAGGAEVSASPGLIEGAFSALLQYVDELIAMKDNIDVKSAAIFGDNQEFFNLIADVEEDFATINREARNLKKMKVLIKIELARIDMESDFTLESIASAVDEVIETINSNQRLFLRLRGFFLSNMEKFNSAMARTRGKLDKSSKTLAGTRAKLATVGQLVQGAVMASNAEMAGIYEQLRQPYHHLSDTSAFTTIISAAKGKLVDAHERVRGLQEQLFTAYGVTQWEQKEENLRQLMDQFTCYVERKAMSDVTGQLIEVGSDTGDIVLF